MKVETEYTKIYQMQKVIGGSYSSIAHYNSKNKKLTLSSIEKTKEVLAHHYINRKEKTMMTNIKKRGGEFKVSETQSRTSG